MAIILPATVVLAQGLAGTIEAFRGEHHGCGRLDGGVDGEVGDEAYLVWMSCSGCGVVFRHWFGPDDEPGGVEPGARSRGGQS